MDKVHLKTPHNWIRQYLNFSPPVWNFFVQKLDIVSHGIDTLFVMQVFPSLPLDWRFEINKRKARLRRLAWSFYCDLEIRVKRKLFSVSKRYVFRHFLHENQCLREIFLDFGRFPH